MSARWLLALRRKHPLHRANLAQNGIQFVGMADFEDGVDDGALWSVARDHLDAQHVDLGARDDARHIT